MRCIGKSCRKKVLEFFGKGQQLDAYISYLQEPEGEVMKSTIELTATKYGLSEDEIDTFWKRIYDKRKYLLSLVKPIKKYEKDLLDMDPNEKDFMKLLREGFAIVPFLLKEVALIPSAKVGDLLPGDPAFDVLYLTFNLMPKSAANYVEKLVETAEKVYKGKI